jgi:hypothetical protein
MPRARLRAVDDVFNVPARGLCYLASSRGEGFGHSNLDRTQGDVDSDNLVSALLEVEGVAARAATDAEDAPSHLLECLTPTARTN